MEKINQLAHLRSQLKHTSPLSKGQYVWSLRSKKAKKKKKSISIHLAERLLSRQLSLMITSNKSPNHRGTLQEIDFTSLKAQHLAAYTQKIQTTGFHTEYLGRANITTKKSSYTPPRTTRAIAGLFINKWRPPPLSQPVWETKTSLDRPSGSQADWLLTLGVNVVVLELFQKMLIQETPGRTGGQLGL